METDSMTQTELASYLETLARLVEATAKDAHGDVVEIAQFVGIDGYNLFTDPARLGTFLPCVASEGQEITRF